MERNQSNLRLFDKVLGALVGFAIGDAMGATTEFMSADEITTKYGRVETILGGGWLNLKPGETTDDTAMMICVARAYTAFAMNKADDFLGACCHQFCIWYNERPKDIGNVCRTVISSCMGLSVDHWKSCAENLNTEYPSLGNGSLMRCLFPAIVGDSALAISQGLLTHYNPECSSAIDTYTNLIQRALYSTANLTKGSVEKEAPEGKAKNTLINTIYWNHTAKSFKQAILGAVNDGGDADTIAALTGGLAGARFGFTKIPTEWIQKLNLETYTALRELSERAIEIIAMEETNK